MSKRKNRLLAEKEVILADMRCPHFALGAKASGYAESAHSPLERRLAEIDAELYPAGVSFGRALAAGSRRAKTPQAVECEASQSGPEGVTPNPRQVSSSKGEE